MFDDLGLKFCLTNNKMSHTLLKQYARQYGLSIMMNNETYNK